MNTEEKHYQLARLYLLNRKNFPAIENIENQQIERCNHYINKFSFIVDELSPRDLSISISETELDQYLDSLEKIYLNHLNSTSYQKLCNALVKLNRWQALKKEFDSL